MVIMLLRALLSVSFTGHCAVFVSHNRADSCSVLTVCDAPAGREKVRAQVILLRVGLATLRFCILVFEQLMGRSA